MLIVPRSLSLEIVGLLRVEFESWILPLPLKVDSTQSVYRIRSVCESQISLEMDCFSSMY